MIGTNTHRKRQAKVLSLLLALSLLFPAAAQAAVPSTPDIQTGTFHFAAHDVSGKDLTDHYIYTDQFFDGSSYTYNEHLATMSMFLASASISSKATTDYAKKSQNLEELLGNLGFSDFATNECYKTQPGEQTMGAACAHKTITVSGKDYTLLVIVPRSAGYEREWAGNFTVGHSTNGDDLHAGFLSARTYVMDFVKSYVAAHHITGKNVKIWTMGYSRGAATANLTAGLLDSTPTALENSITLKPENVYAYTFGTPLCVPTSLRPDADLYKNINNVFADYDPISMLVPAGWGFSRYGVTTYLPVHDSAARTKMLKYLKATNPTVYATYTAENSGADPDNFKPLKFQLANSKLSIVYDADNTDEAKTSQKGFLTDRITALTNNITTRNDYADNYESMLANFMSLYFGMSDDDYATFNSSIGSNKLASITAGLLYATYVTGTYKNNTSTLLAQLKAVDQQIQSDENYAQYTKTSEYAAFSTKLQNMNDESFAAGYDTVYSDLQNLTDAAVKSVFTTALDDLKIASDSTDRNILKDNNITALRKFVSDMMFSPASTDTLEAAFQIDAPPLKRAATLIGNAGSYMRVHNNEIILSWVRTMDDWYTPASSGSGGVIGTPSPSPSPSVSPSPSPSPSAPVIEQPIEEQKSAAKDWAVSQNILQGSGSGYALDEPCTRGQTAALLYRAAGSPQTASGSAGFSDVSDSDYCADAVRWLTQQGITKGTTPTSYGLNDTLTRAQAVTLLYRLSGKTAAASQRFSDVPADAWYAQAVAWAADSGITNGTSADTFSPNDTCTRQQLILFLYRYYNK